MFTKMKNNVFKLLGYLVLPMLMLLGGLNTVQAQTCNPSYVTGNECVGEIILFKANAPGFSSYAWEFKDASGSVVTTSTDRDPGYSFSVAGTYTVTLKATGVAGTCEKSITVVVKPSPTAVPILLTPQRQCFNGNTFCYIDSSTPAPGSTIIRRTYLFGDGQKYDAINPKLGDTICHSVKDPKGGWFNLKIELEDANGCVTEVYLDSAIQVFPRLGVSITSNAPTKCDSTEALITNNTYINWKTNPGTYIGLKDVARFVFDFGDGEVIIGDSVTNTKYWTGKGLDGVISKWYHTNGTFNATLSVTSRFNCSESFTYKAAATNIKLRPQIIADKDSACTDDPVTCFKVSTGPIPGAQFLWNFGDPPSGNLNFDNKSWTPCHSYGGGPWMISLRIVSGPCDIMLFDTISKVGPSSTIEIPFVRVPEHEKYQCTITDSVHFVNNSSWYHNDPNYWDEDPFFIFYPESFRVVRHPVTQVDSIYTYRNVKTNFDTFVAKYEMTDTLYYGSYRAYFDQVRDSFVLTNGTDTVTFLRNLGGVNPRRRYIFNFDEATRAGDQTILPRTPSVRRKDHVLRIWSLGDNYASPCTTDTRANKNVNLNCGFTLDSLPVHWYRPWDEIYMYENNGNFYKTPAPKTLFSRHSRTCYQVQVYAADTVVISQQAVIFAPWDSTVVYEIPYVDSFGVAKTDTITIPAGVDFPEDSLRDNYRLKVWRPKSVYKGKVYSTAIWEDQKYYIPAGVTIKIKDLASTQGNVRTVTGPKTETIKVDEQFEVEEGDSIIAVADLIINAADTTYAAASTIIVDTIINGVETTVQRQEVLVDSAFHRDYFFKTRAQCNTVTLWHKDTIHPFKCESSNNISLALIPPSARGLKWESGIPCPLDGNKLQYYLTFDMAETKPGCTQQWFEVNFDSLTGPMNWLSYKSGNVLAPPPPGLPIPFVLPYDIIGQWGTQFVKGYTSGEVGSDPSKRPNGSFTIGLIVGNGQPAFDKDGNAIAPECTDTAWYSDMFRYQYLDAQFDVLYPNNDPLAICAGETAYFRMVNPIQDSMSALRWNWGYQDRLSGYYEEFQYFQPYKGPQPNRNDKDIVWNGATDEWLYNYVVRHNLDDLYGDVTIDTIVTRIYRDWDYHVNTYQADKILTDILKQMNLDIRDIPAGDFALMLGDGTVGCIDTTGISEYFVIGKIGIEDNVVHHGEYKYQYTNAAKTDSVIIEQVLHFRDSSMQGFDTLIAPYSIETSDGMKFNTGDTIFGVYKFKYEHPEVRINFCDPTKKDTVIVKSNGPMTPGVFLNNRVGCEKTGAVLLNVGYLNKFELLEEAVCKDQVHELYDSIRYWQYGDDMFPDDYPIDPRKFWDDPVRFANGKLELKSIDWNANDTNNKFERNLTFYHQYDSAGEYLVAIATQDSIGCTDTAYVTAMVTGVVANFETNLNAGGDICDGIVSFFDSSVVFDPCRGRDTCPNGKYDPCDSIIWYEWDFGDGSVRSVLKDPAHDYTSSGWFTVKLKVYSLLGCVDSVEKRIFVAGPQPRFEFDGGSVWGEDSIVICVGDSVHIANTSRTPMTSPAWVMDWGDTSVSNSNNINDILIHQYNNPGTYFLNMYMTDEIEPGKPPCGRVFPDTSTKDGKIPRKIKVIVLPYTPAKLEISDTVVCPNQEVLFTSNSDTIYTYYQWAFGDGDTATRSEPVNFVSHSYATPGTYKVLMIPDYDLPPGDFGPKCPQIDSGEVTVVDVTADFDIIDKDKPDYCFTNTSQGANNFEWKFETELRDTVTEFTTGLDQDPSCQNWGETVGTFAICLIATNDIGCKDTTCKTIENNFFIKFVPYNVFTPNTEGDNKNDKFVIDIEGWEEFEINIYNRWGELVFKTDDPINSWDGTIMNKGTKCPAGTYFYVINYKLKNRAENDGLEPVSGTVTLIRD
jgi:gliding motility-associated-like protein